MTTGEYLVAHSTLASGTALAHLLALQTGSGQTIFCSQINAVVEQQELVITRKAKHSTLEAPSVQQPQADARENRITVRSTIPRLYARHETDEITVLQRSRH